MIAKHKSRKLRTSNTQTHTNPSTYIVKLYKILSQKGARRKKNTS